MGLAACDNSWTRKRMEKSYTAVPSCPGHRLANSTESGNLLAIELANRWGCWDWDSWEKENWELWNQCYLQVAKIRLGIQSTSWICICCVHGLLKGLRGQQVRVEPSHAFHHIHTVINTSGCSLVCQHWLPLPPHRTPSFVIPSKNHPASLCWIFVNLLDTVFFHIIIYI